MDISRMIRTIKEFYCPKCGYLTHDQDHIKRIEELGLCPGCGDGKPKKWEHKPKPRATNPGTVPYY